MKVDEGRRTCSSAVAQQWANDWPAYELPRLREEGVPISLVLNTSLTLMPIGEIMRRGGRTIPELRRLLADVDGFPGTCGECTMAQRCRTGCVAQNYMDSRQLVWPDPLCAEAAERDVFPATRRKASKNDKRINEWLGAAPFVYSLPIR